LKFTKSISIPEAICSIFGY